MYFVSAKQSLLVPQTLINWQGHLFRTQSPCVNSLWHVPYPYLITLCLYEKWIQIHCCLVLLLGAPLCNLFQSGNEKYLRAYEELGRFNACSGFQSVVPRQAASTSLEASQQWKLSTCQLRNSGDGSSKQCLNNLPRLSLTLEVWELSVQWT